MKVDATVFSVRNKIDEPRMNFESNSFFHRNKFGKRIDLFLPSVFHTAKYLDRLSFHFKIPTLLAAENTPNFLVKHYNLTRLSFLPFYFLNPMLNTVNMRILYLLLESVKKYYTFAENKDNEKFIYILFQ